MAGELKHGIDPNTHVADGQKVGDIAYFGVTGWVRKAITDFAYVTATVLAAFNYVTGVASGYKVARGETAITGTGEVATGLTTLVQAVACLKDDASLAGDAVTVATHATAGSFTANVWKRGAAADCTPAAATAAKTVRWIAVGT